MPRIARMGADWEGDHQDGLKRFLQKAAKETKNRNLEPFVIFVAFCSKLFNPGHS